ncbi:MAG: amino acid kinase [Candidatus Hydrothermarchaeota archaeon]
MRAVIKWGGSLIDYSEKNIPKIAEMAEEHEILIVPGAGPFSNLVREIDKKYGLDPAISHRMAILAMDQYAYFISQWSEKIKCIKDLESMNKKRLSVLLYSHMEDPFEPSWEVTSDTISAFVAKKTGSMLIIATDVDGVYIKNKLKKEIRAEEILGKETCVDKAFPKFLIENKMDAFVVNGKKVHRIRKILEREDSIYTKIIGGG